MGLTWALGWAIAGILIGVASILLPSLPWDRFFEIFDAPLPALAVPGFFGGVFFSLVLGVAGRRRRFSELSLPRFTAWGVAGGLLLTLFPAALVSVGLATPNGSVWELTAAIGVPLIALSAASAAATLLLARRAEGRSAPATSGDGAGASLGEGAARELDDRVRSHADHAE
jgi:hypothetical protein